MLSWWLWNIPGEQPHPDNEKRLPSPDDIKGKYNLPEETMAGELVGDAIAPATDGWGPYQPILAVTGGKDK